MVVLPVYGLLGGLTAQGGSKREMEHSKESAVLNRNEMQRSLGLLALAKAECRNNG
jgi:hypothetical protein